MDASTFNNVVEEQLKRSTDVLCKKATEYATEDRLHNFKIAASIQHCSQRQALAGMMAKHTVSVYDMCQGNEDYPIELWNEKITDSINYLLLLRAVVDEDKSKLTQNVIMEKTPKLEAYQLDLNFPLAVKIFPTYNAAKKLFHDMLVIQTENQYVTVSDYYKLIGHMCNSVSNNLGWHKLGPVVDIKTLDDGYVVDLPWPITIK